MKQNVIILAASQYQITDDAGKIENSGTTLRYILTEDLSPIENKDRLVKGHIPAKTSVAYEDYHKLGEVPGLYELTMTTRIDSKGTVILVPIDYRFIGGINIAKSAKGFTPAN